MDNYEIECINKYLERLKDPKYIEDLKEQFRNIPTPNFNYLMQPERSKREDIRIELTQEAQSMGLYE